ncbi:MAG TPA: hypothetical protein VGB84_06840 [Arachidicoccus sp.]
MDEKTMDIIRKNDKKFRQARILIRIILWMVIALIFFFQFGNILALGKWLWKN